MPIQAWEPGRRLRFGAPERADGRSHDLTIADAPDGVRTRLKAQAEA